MKIIVYLIAPGEDIWWQMLSRGWKMTLNLPRWTPIAPTPSIYHLLWVMCSFKNSPLFPIFVNWLENLTKWRLLYMSSIPGWTFDDKRYLGGQKWHWPCPIGVMLHAGLYTEYSTWMVPLNAWRELLFLLINLTILQNEDYCLSHRSRRGHLMTNVI